MHQVVLRELDNATPPVIFERSQQIERLFLSTERKKANILPIYKKRKKEDLENYMLISFTVSPGKMMDKMIQTYKGQEGYLEQ